MTRAGGDPGLGSIELGAGPLLGLLAAPGAFQCFLLLDKYSSLLNWFRSRGPQDLLLVSVPDKFLFVTLSMVLTGIVTVLKSDRIMPDSQDYINLAHLPVQPRTILSANVVAIGISAILINVFVNAASSLLFPFVVASAAPVGSVDLLRFFAAHVLCVSLAGFFTFLSVMAVMGTAAAVTPHVLYAGTMITLRGVLLVILLVGALSAGNVSFRLPPAWFVGLYQSMQERGPQELAILAPFAWTGTAVVLLLACCSYALWYRRGFRAVSAYQGVRTGLMEAPLSGALYCVMRLHSSFDRAVAMFVVRCLLRHGTPRLALLVPAGLGWVIAWQTYPGEAAPYIPAFLLIAGLRVTFDLPAELSANWTFRILLLQSARSARLASRYVTAAMVVMLVVAPAAGVWLSSGVAAREMLVRLACLFFLSMVLTEIVLFRQHRIPFTCEFPPLRQDLPVRCISCLIAFALFVFCGAELTKVVSAHPLTLLAIAMLPVALCCVTELRSKRARESSEREDSISFTHTDENELCITAISTPRSRV